MELVPSEQDVVEMLRRTGALRDGHFEYRNGLHSNECLEIPLAMRYYREAKILSVGLSRLLRADREIRAMIPELSVVTPSTAGMPVAYGICEALGARQVYWAEQGNGPGTLRFRQNMGPLPGERVVVVDDLLRTGIKLCRLKMLLQDQGACVAGMAVLVYQPTPRTPDFAPLPLFYLARLDAIYYRGAASCELCRDGLPLETVRQ